MFCLADVMTYVEVGTAMAKKAAGLAGDDAPQARKIVAMSRIFAAEVAEVVSRNWMRIVPGSARTGSYKDLGVEAPFGTEDMAQSHLALIHDMDLVARILYETA